MRHSLGRRSHAPPPRAAPGRRCPRHLRPRLGGRTPRRPHVGTGCSRVRGLGRASSSHRQDPHRGRHGRGDQHGRPRGQRRRTEGAAQGGNAVDAAVAAAAALGVTEPYSAGIGGGGYFVYYNAKTGKVRTIDGRETAPGEDAAGRLHRPGDRQALPVHPRPRHQRRLGRHARHAGDVGPRARQVGHADHGRGARARRRGRHPRVRRRRDLPPADARERDPLPRVQGHPQALPAGGDAPEVGSIFRNPQLARTYYAARRAGPALLLPRRARGPHGRRGAPAAHDQHHRRSRCRRAS